MLRKLKLLAVSLGLCLTAAPPVVASGMIVRHEQAPRLESASTNCQTINTIFSSYNDWGSAESDGYNGYVDAVQADIYDSGRLWECLDTTGTDIVSGASYWVALTGNNLGPDTIVQVGVIKCHSGVNEPSDSACYGSRAGTARYFYAWGGSSEARCGYSTHHPRPMDLGPATTGWHNFRVYYNANNERIYFYIDGTSRASISSTTMCWVEGGYAVRAHYDVERWDQGDGVGDVDYPVMFQNTEVRNAGAWHWTNDLDVWSTNSEIWWAYGSTHVSYWTIQH